MHFQDRLASIILWFVLIVGALAIVGVVVFSVQMQARAQDAARASDYIDRLIACNLANPNEPEDYCRALVNSVTQSPHSAP